MHRISCSFHSLASVGAESLQRHIEMQKCREEHLKNENESRCLTILIHEYYIAVEH